MMLFPRPSEVADAVASPKMSAEAAAATACCW